jgi:hypothetical protein
MPNRSYLSIDFAVVPRSGPFSGGAACALLFPSVVFSVFIVISILAVFYTGFRQNRVASLSFANQMGA